MRGRKDDRIFDSQTRQLVDVEEAPVVDFIDGRAPIGQPIGLDFEQPVQSIETGTIPRRPVECLEG